ncbi:MAG: protein-tyrosine-phosphatase [Flavobacteriaceae bacterium]|nr:protein-tyrosine-phosphatase [Flavobacteriaceae bacterium]
MKNTVVHSRILFVCLGNICRSPIAEGILKKYLPKDFFIDSAGTASYHIGCSPDPRSIKIASKYDIDISNLRARQFIKNDFKEFDYIYAMDKSNLINIQRLDVKKKYVSKIKLLIPEKDVPDPYYGEMEDFNNCFKLIDIQCKKISANMLEIYD